MDKLLPERKLNRWHKFDYSNNGFYFVTICVKYRVKFFGSVKNGKMILNKYGRVVEQQWLWLEKQYPWINLDEFIIMPNHLHGIIKINRGNHVGTTLGLSLHKKQKLYKRQKNLLSKSICAFKTTSSKKIRQINHYNFTWQRSFHDRIIRNEMELNRIRHYIRQNPKKWYRDRNNRGILM